MATAGLIYKRTNIVTGKVYIGQSSRLRDDYRWGECVYEAKRGGGFRLGAAIRKYGEASFEYKVLCYATTQKEIDKLETFFILAYNSHIDGYNVTTGGKGNNGPCTALRREAVRKAILALPEEVRRQKKTPFSDEHKKNIGLSSSLRRHSLITKEKNRKASLENWKDEAYRKITLENRSSRKRTRIRICYICFKSFTAANLLEQVICSQKCVNLYNREFRALSGMRCN